MKHSRDGVLPPYQAITFPILIYDKYIIFLPHTSVKCLNLSSQKPAQRYRDAVPCPHKATSPEEAQFHHLFSHSKYPSPIQPGGSLLSFFHLINVPPTLWAPKLDAVFQEGPSKCQTGANSHFNHYQLQKIMKG